MNAPAVDIVIPYFNGIEYLNEAIESVRLQSFQNFRLLVIDDGTNNSLAEELIESLGDPRIEYQFNKKNIGLSANFEKAKNAIKAEWGVILGHDDRLHVNYLEEMLSAVELAPSAVIIQAQVDVIDQDGSKCNSLPDRAKNLIRLLANLTSKPIAKNLTLVKSRRAIEAIMVGDFLYFPTIMWKTQVLTAHTFRQDLDITLDLEIIINVLLGGGDLLLVNKTLAEYRRHKGSLSGKPELKLHRMSEEVGIYSELAQLFKSRKLRMSYWLAKTHIFTRLHILVEIIRALLNRRYRDFFEYLRLILL